ANLRRHVERLADRIGPRSGLDMPRLEAAAAYVESELQRAGWPTARQPVGNGTGFTNVVAMRRAAWPALLIVGAHYDTVPGSPGADDNASGVAGLLEIARLLSSQPELPVRLVAFVNEEAPLGRTALRGSSVAAAASSSDGEHLRGMIALESIGFFSTVPGSQ